MLCFWNINITCVSVLHFIKHENVYAVLYKKRCVYAVLQRINECLCCASKQYEHISLLSVSMLCFNAKRNECVYAVLKKTHECVYAVLQKQVLSVSMPCFRTWGCLCCASKRVLNKHVYLFECLYAVLKKMNVSMLFFNKTVDCVYAVL